MRISTNNFYFNFRAQKKNQPVYSVDEHKNVQRFETRKDAAVALGINPSTISGVLLGQLNRSGIYTFLSPEEIEKIGEDGQVKIDDKKVEEAKNKIITAIYVIDKHKNYVRYETQKEASLSLGVATGNISRCLLTEGKSNGYVFVSATEVEKVDENGNVVVDVEKIEKLSAKLSEDEAIYVLDDKGAFQRFNTINEAAETTGVNPSDLTKGFNGFKKVIDGNTYVKAKNLETKKINGQYVLDEDKLIALFIGNRASLYALNERGQARFFKTQTDASKKLGISSFSITSCLKGVIKNIDGYTFAKPNQVLGINEQNQITFNRKKVKTLLADRFEK